MKFTLSWLKEYLETDASLSKICHSLNNIGLEVENVTDYSKNLSCFTVAKIITTDPHPNSSKLQICQVDIGKKENIQIICGAQNARSGLKVAYAPIDSTIPSNGMKIKKAKIAGVESFGMLCSAFELSLENDAEGIIEIDNNFIIGTKISEVFGLNDAVLEINVTPNRGDCLGVIGISRDLNAAGVGTLKLPKVNAIKGSFVSPIGVKIFSKNCQYFSGFYIKNIKHQNSPKWLKDRLKAVECSSVSAIIDITNYVMLCLNQPLHSYDADKLYGDITIVDAIVSEEFKSLKLQNYQLLGGETIIKNNGKNIALAGIIGGLEAATTNDTKNIFLEAAFFDPSNIARSGRSLNILSDARYRFERGLDLNNVKNALTTAANLIVEICGGEISEVVEDGNNIATNLEIKLDLRQIKRIIGIEIEKSIVVKILQNLGFFLQELDDNFLQVQVPNHRNDIKIFQDLIEEIIRIYGLEKIISQPLRLEKKIDNKQSLLEFTQDKIRLKLTNLGLTEVINYSFIDQKTSSLFADFNPKLQLQNPISSQMSQMRPTLIAGLLQNISKNQMRGFADLSFFEIGRIFLGTDPSQQKNIIAGLLVGKNKYPNHYKDQRNFDVFDVKKNIFDCLEILGFSSQSFQMTKEVPNYYHPFRSKALRLGKKIIGYFGELHPLVIKKLDVKGRVNVFELLFEELPLNFSKKNSKKPFIISDFLPVNRDFAFILDSETEVNEVLKKVSEIDKNLIKNVSLFDVYCDSKLGNNKKSIAISVQIQPNEKTLTGIEIEEISNKIIFLVKEQFAGILRE
jgi:phenylalanyl-tRNA synthetase beta chain